MTASANETHLPIVADYSYVAADFQESATAQIQAITGRTQQKRRQPFTGLGMIVWVFFVTLIVIFVYLEKLNQPARQFSSGPGLPMTAGRLPTHNFLQTLCVSTAAPAFLIAFLLFVASGNPNQRKVPFYTPKLARPTIPRVLLKILAAILCLAGIVALMAIFQLPTEPDWRPTAPSLFAVLAGPWAVFFIIAVVMAKISTQRTKQRQSGPFDPEGASSHEPQHLEADDDRIAVSTPLVQHLFTWPYFVSYLESQNLLMLFTRDLTVQIIPKRAFTQPGSFERFCGLVQNHVQAGQFLPRVSAFAVLPIIPPAQPGHS